MNEEFRISRSIQIQVIFSASLFLVGTLGSVALLFMKDPRAQGFGSEHSARVLAALGISVCGMMTLTSLYPIATYRRVWLAVTDGAVVVRLPGSQTRRFQLSQIDKIRWVQGSVGFHCGRQKAVLVLGNFQPEDRLRIIRLLRKLVPEEKQDGWPLFCHRVALPLRDGASAQERVWLASAKASENPFVLITRRRYDLQFAVAFPLGSIAAFISWWKGFPQLFVLPIMVIFWWLLLRYHVPPRGSRQISVIKTFGGPLTKCAAAWLVVSLLCLLSLHFINISQNAAQWIPVGLLAPWCPLAFYWALRVDKQLNRDNLLGAASAVECWEAGERALDSRVA